MTYQTLTDLHRVNYHCKRCELREDALCVNLGQGKQSAKVVMVSCSPTYNESAFADAYSERTGFLLQRLIEKSKLPFQEIYFTYLVKCWSKLERNKDHINICKNWLHSELDVIKPKFVVAFGSDVCDSLMGDTEYKYGDILPLPNFDGIKLLCWYKLYYLLTRGKKLTNDTISYLSRIKNEISQE